MYYKELVDGKFDDITDMEQAVDAHGHDDEEDTEQAADS